MSYSVRLPRISLSEKQVLRKYMELGFVFLRRFVKFYQFLQKINNLKKVSIENRLLVCVPAHSSGLFCLYFFV